MDLINKMEYLQNLMNLSLEEQILLSKRFQEDDVGLVNSKTGSVMRLKDNGTVQITAGIKENPEKQTITFRLNPEAQSANLFAPKTNIFSERVNFQIKDDGFWINYRPLNPHFLNSNLVEMNDEAIRYLNQIMTTGYDVGMIPTPPSIGGEIKKIKPFLKSREQQEFERASQELRNLIDTSFIKEI